MFTYLRTEVTDRFTAVESFFKATRAFDKELGQTAKGLAFVHMYAAYEYTVKNVMRTAVDAITAHAHKIEDLTPTLMALFLDSELRGLRDCPTKREWEYRMNLFERLYSNAPIRVANTVFPNDGNHFRHGQLQTIFNVLGIKRTPAQRQKHLLRIDEVVNHRNNIAHGQDTADSVGKRYTRAEVFHIIQQIKSVCLLLISVIELHCTKADRQRRK